jgi:hypothetical protein
MASTYLDMPAANAALKEFYGDQDLQDVTYKDNPLWGLISKNAKGDLVAGKYYPQPVRFANGQGVSNTFANAQGNQTATQMTSFLVTYQRDYGVATMDGMTIRAMANDTGAFVRAADAHITPVRQQVVNNIAGAQYRNGTGIIGQISATPTSGLITLSDINTVTQFEYGQTLVACTGADCTGSRAALGYVIAVDPSIGTVTVSTSQGGAGTQPGSWAASDYLYVQGNNNARITGLASWLPTTSPTSTDNFFGVNRFASPTRLAGFRYDASAVGVEEGLIEGLARGAREGAAPDYVFCNFSYFAALTKSLHGKVEYVDIGTADGHIGFSGLRFHGPNGEMKIVPDRNCPSSVAYALDLETVKLVSLGEAPHFLEEDGMMLLRVSNADAYECRIGSYSNLVVEAPGRNVVLVTPV